MLNKRWMPLRVSFQTKMGMALQMDTRAVLLNELNIQFSPSFFPI